MYLQRCMNCVVMFVLRVVIALDADTKLDSTPESGQCHSGQHLTGDEIEQLIREANADTRPSSALSDAEHDTDEAKRRLERKLFCLQCFYDDHSESSHSGTVLLTALELVTKWLGTCPHWTVEDYDYVRRQLDGVALALLGQRIFGKAQCVRRLATGQLLIG